MHFFENTLSQQDAKLAVSEYVNNTDPASPYSTWEDWLHAFEDHPVWRQSYYDSIEYIDDNVTFYSVSASLDANITAVMNTDDCFRLFLLSPNGLEHVKFMNQTANNIRRPLPVGLSTDAGLVVANPAYMNQW